MLPPFFMALKDYTELDNLQYDCPGHQGGQYFKKHPAGKVFYDFYGENIFRSDICNADVELGDMLIHQGPPEAAQKYAAKVFNADKTYFYDIYWLHDRRSCGSGNDRHRIFKSE